MSSERVLFVTGRLAEFSLRRVVSELSKQIGFDYDVAVLGISVAALMHVDWLSRKLSIDSRFDRVVLPGWCQGDLQVLVEKFGTAVQVGPKNLHDLPEFFCQQQEMTPTLDNYDIEILAEINHAPKLSDEQIVMAANRYRDSGANVIDLGCIPGESWNRAGEIVGQLKQDGFRVSIDSFERAEVESAVENGAELVLSCNSSNLDWVTGLDVELVAIPDDVYDLSTLERTLQELERCNSRFRIDPILEPIGFGFSKSLARFFEARRRWPDAEIMMGIGNLTELSEVDSAGVNFLLAGICQELSIRSVLTTEVINWCRSAVKEFDVARRIMHHSINHQVLPKHLDSSLVMLRDAKVREMSELELAQLASQLKDPNLRIFVEAGELHLMNRDGYWHGSDPFALFDLMFSERRKGAPDLKPSHVFYLGYEMSKAVTAMTLGKQYTQDEPLQWGFLTADECSAIERRGHAAGDSSD